MKTIAARMLVAAALAGAVAPAEAAIVDGTFSGTISYGSDDSGYFSGTAGASLEGPITGTFTYDTSLAQQTLPGEYAPAGAAEWLNFTVTIGSATYSFGSFPATASTLVQTATVLNNAPFVGDSFDLTSERDGMPGSEQLTLDLSFGNDFLTSTALPLSFNFVAPSNSENLSTLNLLNTSANATVLFTVQSASAGVRQTGAVPEPTTWTMMIGGFGLVGGALRRRRALPLAA